MIVTPPDAAMQATLPAVAPRLRRDFPDRMSPVWVKELHSSLEPVNFGLLGQVFKSYSAIFGMLAQSCSRASTV